MKPKFFRFQTRQNASPSSYFWNCTSSKGLPKGNHILFSPLLWSLFSLGHLRSTSWHVLCNMTMSRLLIGCVSVFITSGIISSLFTCHCFCFGQPTLWNVTIFYRELRKKLLKRHVLRPSICVAPWGSCHMEVPTIPWLFGFGVKKKTLLASQRLLSLFQGDPKWMTLTLKVVQGQIL